MDRLEWSDRYLIGEKRIDRQHRGLFELVNKLVDCCEKNPEREVVSDTFAALTDYAREHFRTEEAIMEEVDFPDRHHHAEIHLDFAARVGELAMATFDGDPEVLAKLTEYLRSWLDGHILGDDLLLKLHLEKIRGSS